MWDFLRKLFSLKWLFDIFDDGNNKSENEGLQVFRRLRQAQQCKKVLDRAFFKYNYPSLIEEALMEASDVKCIFNCA